MNIELILNKQALEKHNDKGIAPETPGPKNKKTRVEIDAQRSGFRFWALAPVHLPKLAHVPGWIRYRSAGNGHFPIKTSRDRLRL